MLSQHDGNPPCNRGEAVTRHMLTVSPLTRQSAKPAASRFGRIPPSPTRSLRGIQVCQRTIAPARTHHRRTTHPAAAIPAWPATSETGEHRPATRAWRDARAGRGQEQRSGLGVRATCGGGVTVGAGWARGEGPGSGTGELRGPESGVASSRWSGLAACEARWSGPRGLRGTMVGEIAGSDLGGLRATSRRRWSARPTGRGRARFVLRCGGRGLGA